MANPFTAPTISGYNASPPPDDGTQSEANRLNWSKHISKIGDPLKNWIDATLSAITAAFAKRFLNSSSTHSSGYTVVTADEGKLLRVSGTTTINLIAAATAGDGFVIPIKNVDTGTVTIDPDGSETIDGAATFTLAAQEAAILMCDGSNWQVVGRRATTVSAASDTAAGIIEIATDAEMATATSETLAVTPGRMQWHPLMAQAYLVHPGSTGDVAPTKQVGITGNVSSTAAGVFAVTLSEQMADANYPVHVTGLSTAEAIGWVTARSTTGFTAFIANTSGVGVNDRPWCATVLGDRSTST